MGETKKKAQPGLHVSPSGLRLGEGKNGKVDRLTPKTLGGGVATKEKRSSGTRGWKKKEILWRTKRN